MVRSPALPFRTRVLLFLLAGSTAALSAAAQPPATQPATRPAATRPTITRFQPGINIDWSESQVEIDVTVILRNGPIELFACSPRQREHEAIVRIEAVPTQVYQALGLIGLTPGKPAYMNEQGEVIPASGDPVDIDVRYSLDGMTRQEPIELWMSRAEGDAPLGRQFWVFAGSIPLEDGKRIASDLEGTVVAVVDFPTALIALPEHHTDRNEALWLRPNTERIPPLGTKGQMIIRPAALRLKLTADGRVHHNGRVLDRAELTRLIAARLSENPRLRVEVASETGSEAEEEKKLFRLLQELKIGEESITVLRSSTAKRP